MGNCQGAIKALSDDFCNVEHRSFIRVPNVVWSRGESVIHHCGEPAKEVVNIAETSSLGAVSVYCEWLGIEGCDNHVANNSSVVGSHLGAIGIKDPCNLDFGAVVPLVVKA